jgi:predicted DNA-binding transcriptional regulator YafY
MVKRPGFPSLEDIIHRLEDHDFFISARTLQRDFAKINADFGIDIQYNYYHKGYYVEEADSKEYNSVMKFLELSVMAGTFNELATDRKSLRELVSFDSEDQVRGVEYIPGILFAIKNRRLITIKYQKFSDSAPYERKVKPGLMKEYDNRWYLAAINYSDDMLKIYALDRMQGITLTGQRFKAADITWLKEKFVHVIGVSKAGCKPEFIELTFLNEQAEYIKTLPWHNSQEIIGTAETETTFRYFVVPNYELEQKILSEGNNITRIHPEWLATKIEEKRK